MASNSRKKEGRGGFSPEGDNINKETRTGNTRRLSPHLQGTTESIRTGRKPIRVSCIVSGEQVVNKRNIR